MLKIIHLGLPRVILIAVKLLKIESVVVSYLLAKYYCSLNLNKRLHPIMATNASENSNGFAGCYSAHCYSVLKTLGLRWLLSVRVTVFPKSAEVSVGC